MANPLDAFRRSGNHQEDEEVQEAMEREDLPWGPALKFLWKRLWYHPWLVVTSILLGVGIAAAEVVSLSLIMPFIDALSGGGGQLSGETKLAFMVPYFQQFSTVAQIRLIAVGLVTIQLFKSGLKYLSGRIASYQKILMDRDLKNELFDHLMELDLRFINKERTGNLYTIVQSYSGDVSGSAKRLLKAVPKVSSFLGMFVAMLLLSWKMTLFALTLAFVTTYVIDLMTDIFRRMSRRINVFRVRLQQTTLQALHGLKLIRLFGREEHVRDEYRENLQDYQDGKYRRASLRAAVSPLYQTMMTGMFALILIAGTFVLDTAAATWVAVLTMFMIVMSRLMGPTSTYARTKTKLAKDLPSLEEVIDFLERDDTTSMKDGDVPFSTLDEGIEVENAWFRYTEDDDWVLRDVNFEIPQGQTVALVGSSGAGKTTTVDLIARLYDPTRGSIRVDGTDLRDLRIKNWRHSIAVVNQDTFLFNDSALENIRFGRLDATEEEVVEAAKMANAHGFIQDLPEGYDTQLGERGVRLSGGQSQRIAIARAILADPELLLLDEATSSLDTETEREVQQALDRVSRDRTVVAIAHRLSTIRDADEIVVLEDGEIVERGRHEELLARQGHYWRYVQMQDLLGGAEELAEDEIHLELNGAEAKLRNNGHVLGDVSVVSVGSSEQIEDALESIEGDIGILPGNSERAVVRIGSLVKRDVPVGLEDGGSASDETEP